MSDKSEFKEKKELLSAQVKELMRCISTTSLYIETVKSRKESTLNLSRVETELNEATIKLSSAIDTLNYLKYISKTKEKVKEIYINPSSL